MDITPENSVMIVKGIKNNRALKEIKLLNITQNSLNLLKNELITSVLNLNNLLSFSLSNC